ncbi:N-terminal domain of galactosyltransferase [Popillia japonica]|uniref:Beta-1,4-N-acetylgalactosaminyltransferase n=1 Tax=Popillia japonica TaxID=7064 RepID=A0AAW1LG35_POPJA
MPSWCTWSTLYKGFFTLVVALILLVYRFGSIDSKSWDVRTNYSATRYPRTSRFSELMHNPLGKLINNLQGRLNVVKNSVPTVYELEKRFRLNVVKNSVPTVYELEKRFPWLKLGGHGSPEHCKVEKKVAIIIPFRARGEHLLLFLQHMHPFLKRQLLDYTIFVIEQHDTGPFNRAMLMNIGFKEALKIRNFDCFIFHDVDLLPEDDRNLYNCPTQPRHMSVAIDVFRYKLPYRTIFGGVSAITREHFHLLNGFSNSFWGWGGEDDDMSNRINYHNLHISRYPVTIARYTMLTHKKDKPSPQRYDVLKAGQKRFDTDGLNTLKYTVKQVKEHLLYTWILVSIEPPR